MARPPLDPELLANVEMMVGQKLTRKQQDILANSREAMELTTNLLQSRANFLQHLIDPRRDIDAECGYPSDQEMTPAFYQNLYNRESTATRVVELFPKESWKVQPMIYEDEDPDTITPFEKDWDGVSLGLRGKSWYKKELGNPVWEYLKRADIRSGIGRYGVILLGLNDGKKLETRAAGIDEQGNKVPIPGEKPKLNFIRCFPESHAEILEVEGNLRNPRYGQPTKYKISFHRLDEDYYPVQPTVGTDDSFEVHWSRVIHVVDTPEPNEILSVPRLRPVTNKVLNLIKLYGGSAEMYWRGAFPGLSIESHPNLGGNPKVNTTTLRDQLWRYQNGLQRMLTLLGMSVKSLAPQVVDPTPQIDVQLNGICIVLGVPKRIFMGSERGELASSQDDSSWDERISERQQQYLTPRVIVPFVDRLICLGVLTEPGEKGYTVEWPDTKSIGKESLAKIGMIRGQTIGNYLTTGSNAMMAPMDFWTKEMHYSEEDARIIVENAKTHLEEANPDTPDSVIVPGVQPTPPPLDMGTEMDGQGDPIMPVSGTRPPKRPKGRDNNQRKTA